VSADEHGAELDVTVRERTARIRIETRQNADGVGHETGVRSHTCTIVEEAEPERAAVDDGGAGRTGDEDAARFCEEEAIFGAPGDGEFPHVGPQRLTRTKARALGQQERA
jgi:hypothetical protein